MKRSASWSWVLVPMVFGCAGCSSCNNDGNRSDTVDCGERFCSAGTPTGVPKGLTADGRVAVTAAEAWPNRGMEPAPLTPQELADACALINACKTEADGKSLTDIAIATLTQDCAKGKSAANAKEERGIPQAGQNERFTLEARAVLAGPHDCASIRAQATPRRSEILCQEDGCWWESPVPAPPACCLQVPTVTCKGDVATLVTEGLTITRDCSRAFAKCDEKSSTGCTDRAPVGCDSTAKDTCDGDVKLGCDGDNRVSFHDCARYPGGKCVLNPGGATCDLHEDMTCSGGCDASAPNKLDVCVAGVKVTVDCAALGAGACSQGHCTPK
ncbi:MAG: hypothetical protein ACXVEF_42805 [Polyangiales bacterium]